MNWRESVATDFKVVAMPKRDMIKAKMAIFWAVVPRTTHNTAIFVLTAVRTSNPT
jgi:hypothetical protein